MALNSWYVNVLACYPAYRGKGLGTKLLKLADRIGVASGLFKMSVIVAGNNVGARRLYEKQGYRQVEIRPCIRGDWETGIEEWLLLMKAV